MTDDDGHPNITIAHHVPLAQVSYIGDTQKKIKYNAI